MVKRILILMVIGALLAPTHTLGEPGRTEAQTYVAGAFGAVASPWCYAGGLTPVAENVGGACFDVEAGETAVSLQLTDFALGDVGYMFRFVARGADAPVGPWQMACGVHTIPIPPGVDKVDVAPLADESSPNASPDGNADACGLPSNWGRITATFS